MLVQRRHRWILLFIAPILLLTSAVAKAAEPAAGTPATIAALIEQLDADEFSLREAASRRLTELGAAALPEVAKAAELRSLEVRTRAFAVLQHFQASDDAALQAQAREALKAIAAKRDAAEKNKDEALASAAAAATVILGRPFLGLMGNGASEATVGAVVEGSPAEKAGLKPGDVVLSFADVPTPTFAALIAAVAKKEPGDREKVEISRDGETMKIELTVGRYPGMPVAAVEEVEEGFIPGGFEQ